MITDRSVSLPRAVQYSRTAGVCKRSRREGSWGYTGTNPNSCGYKHCYPSIILKSPHPPPRFTILCPVLPLYTCGRYSRHCGYSLAGPSLSSRGQCDQTRRAWPCVSIESGPDFGVAHRVDHTDMAIDEIWKEIDSAILPNVSQLVIGQVCRESTLRQIHRRYWRRN